jgi:hypothetical protein
MPPASGTRLPLGAAEAVGDVTCPRFGLHSAVILERDGEDCMSHDTTLSVGHLFKQGDTVEAHPRIADVLDGAPLTKAAATGKVDRDGNVTFKGLEEHGPYHAVGKTQVHVTKPGAPAQDTTTDTQPQEQYRSLRFTADGPKAREELQHTQLQTNVQAQAEAEAAAAVTRGEPARVHPNANREVKVGTGAIDTQTSADIDSSAQESHDPDRAEAERRKLEAVRIRGNHPEEAERLEATAAELARTPGATKKPRSSSTGSAASRSRGRRQQAQRSQK